MQFLSDINPLFVGSGFVVGGIVGLTGVGGGSLMTPLLVLLFGIHPVTAVGTDLLYAGLTKSVGAGVHGRAGAINWRVVGLMAAGSIPGSAATLLVLAALGTSSSASSSLISVLLGVFLLAAVVGLLLRDRMLLISKGLTDLPPGWQAGLTILIGLVVGVVVSISSVGAGAIGATALFFLYPRLPVTTIVASDIAHAIPLTLMAGAGYWYLGAVDWQMLASLLLGSVPGIILGSLLAPHLPDRVLRMTLAAVLAIVGTRLVFV